MTNTEIHISVKTLLVALTIILSVLALMKILDVIVLLFLAVIIMSALNPIVNRLEAKKIPRPLAILMLYMIVFGTFGILFGIIIPPLSIELGNMIRQIQSRFSLIEPNFSQFSWSIADLNEFLQQFGQSFQSVISIISSTFSGIVFFFTLLVMSFYLLNDRHHIHQRLFWGKHSEKSEKLLKEFIDTIEQQLGGWVRGQLILMMSIGLITYISLSLMGIPYALPLAVLAGLLEILPNLGPTIAAIPAIIVAFLFLSPTVAGVLALVYFAVQQLENNILVPKIMKAAVNVEPMMSILLILAGFKLQGVVGALLAIPIYIVFRSAFMIYLRETKRL